VIENKQCRDGGAGGLSTLGQVVYSDGRASRVM